MHSINDQLAALKRIAVFSAGLRGHALGEWRNGNGFALASCIYCGCELRANCSPLQPDIDGPCLEGRCMKSAAAAA